ncbi:hypothetical protein [Nocardia arthritidis]|uniref:Uncharacterized protein n=1 Tax=Nocardia arthritidis TaxID=228602 RepID=A0A6G9YUV7_9NOCA|nr:hypothetical protein [Nocardia arthritidis]QIS16633.1 hypothetical protein F5544_44150 [Nocardia arthritidis]
MTDLDTGAAMPFRVPAVPLVAGLELATASTPLRRAAGRLQAVLPPGWRVEVVDAPERPGRERESILRVVMPEN